MLQRAIAVPGLLAAAALLAACPSTPGPRGDPGPAGPPGAPGVCTVSIPNGGGTVASDGGAVLVQVNPTPRHGLVMRQGDGGVVGHVVSPGPPPALWLERTGCLAWVVFTGPLPDWPVLAAGPEVALGYDEPTCSLRPFLRTTVPDIGCYTDVSGAWYRPVQPIQLRVYPAPYERLDDGGCQTIAPNTRGLVLEPVATPAFSGPFTFSAE